MKTLILTSLLSLGCALVARAEPARDGILDPRFGVGGIRTVASVDGGTLVLTYVRDLVRQADGKLLIVAKGYRATTPGLEQPAVLRLNADGSIDEGYGQAGVFMFPPGGLTSVHGGAANSGALLSDGRLLLVGQLKDDSGPNYRRCLLVFAVTPSGVLDASYGPGPGPACVDFGTIGGEFLIGEVLGGTAALPAGKALVVAPTGLAAPGSSVIARLDSEGKFDAGFDGDGLLYYGTSFYSAGFTKPGVVVRADGSVLVPGTSAGRMSVARIASTGALDATFGDSGIASVDVAPGSNDELLLGIAVDASDRIVLAGKAPNCTHCIVRLLPGGALDTTFNASGVHPGAAGLALIVEPGAEARRVVVLPDGKIVVPGYAAAPLGGWRFAAIALDETAAFDARFGDPAVPGHGYYAIANGMPSAAAIAGAAGEIVIAGYVMPAQPATAAIRLMDDQIMIDGFE